MNRDYTYCKGKGCALCMRCRQYTDGRNVPTTGFGWWLEQCDEETRECYDEL